MFNGDAAARRGGAVTWEQLEAGLASGSPELCRGARAEVARTAVADYELGQIAPQARTLRDLVAALEAAGIEFLPPRENVSRGGVMLKWENAAERREEAQYWIRLNASASVVPERRLRRIRGLKRRRHLQRSRIMPPAFPG